MISASSQQNNKTVKMKARPLTMASILQFAPGTCIVEICSVRKEQKLRRFAHVARCLAASLLPPFQDARGARVSCSSLAFSKAAPANFSRPPIASQRPSMKSRGSPYLRGTAQKACFAQGVEFGRAGHSWAKRVPSLSFNLVPERRSAVSCKALCPICRRANILKVWPKRFPQRAVTS